MIVLKLAIQQLLPGNVSYCYNLNSVLAFSIVISSRP